MRSAAFARMIVLPVGTIAGGRAIAETGSPTWALVVLVLTKILVELYAQVLGRGASGVGADRI